MAYNTRRASKRPMRKPVARRNMRVAQRGIRERRANVVRREFMRQANVRVSQETVDDVLDEVEDEGITIEEAVARRARRIRARRARRNDRPNYRKANRRMRRRAQSEEELEDEQEDMEDEKEARRRAARKRAMMKRRAKSRRRAQEDDAPEADIEPDEDEKEARRRRARKRAMMKRKAECDKGEKKDEKDDEKEARRRMARKRALARMRMRRRAEVSDDLTGPDGDSAGFTQARDTDMPSDDLATPDEGDGGVAQTPPPSVDEAEDKVLAAYRLIDAQIAHGAVDPKISKSALASKYCKRYTLNEMRIATQQLGSVGKADKVAGKNVRVQRRSAAIKNANTRTDGFDAECVFA